MQAKRSLQAVPVSHAVSSAQQFVSVHVSQVASVLKVNAPQPIEPEEEVDVEVDDEEVDVEVDDEEDDVGDVPPVPPPPVPPPPPPHATSVATEPTAAAQAQIFMLLDLQPLGETQTSTP
jgi:hypothetical protein